LPDIFETFRNLHLLSNIQTKNMYDFFTELDSDLQNTSGTNAISKNKTPVIKQFTPSIVADTT
jgi:hypothetical protein